MNPFEEQPETAVVRCPCCGIDAMAVQTRLAEMPATADGVRAWKSIGRIYIHPRRRMCDQAFADVVERRVRTA